MPDNSIPLSTSTSEMKKLEFFYNMVDDDSKQKDATTNSASTVTFANRRYDFSGKCINIDSSDATTKSA